MQAPPTKPQSHTHTSPKAILSPPKHSKPLPHVMTPEEQTKAICQAFYKNENLLDEPILQNSIGKKPPKVMDPQAKRLQYYADNR